MQTDNLKEFASLHGKVALITGAAGGIGRAAAEEFASAGAHVVATDLPSLESNGPTGTANRVSGSIEFVGADLTSYESVTTLVESVLKSHERIDVFFGNAGTYSSRRAHSLPVDEYRRVMAVCVDANFFAVKAIVPHMRARRSGVFLFTGSTAAIQGMPNSIAYSMAKHALIGLVQSIAIDYGHEGIRALAILPGPTVTPMLNRIWGTEGPLHDVIVAATASKRLGQPEDQARTARFLVSDDASFLNGIAVPVDGGMSTGQVLLKELIAKASQPKAG
jgi:meso-butanediol dehydrogenase/(S,S)-butanediol dehydrogenase/diacetyl reductase